MDKQAREYEALCQLEEEAEAVTLLETWQSQQVAVDAAYYRTIANHKADSGVKELFLGIDTRPI